MLSFAPGRPILTDGSKGVLSFHKMGSLKHVDDLVVTEPSWVDHVHQQYVNAGSDIIQTFTFGLNGRNRADDLTADDIYARNFSAVQIARKAVNGRNVLVAASIGPLLGELIGRRDEAQLRSRYFPYAHAVELYKNQMAACIAGGADILNVETINDPASVEAALEAASQANSDAGSRIPLAISMNFGINSRTKGWRTLHGMRPIDLVDITNEKREVVAIGSNCGLGYRNAGELAKEFANANPKSAIIWMKQNAGMPIADGSPQPRYDLATPEYSKKYAREVYDAGARAIGGCCGTTPELIAAMKEELVR